MEKFKPLGDNRHNPPPPHTTPPHPKKKKKEKERKEKVFVLDSSRSTLFTQLTLFGIDAAIV